MAIRQEIAARSKKSTPLFIAMSALVALIAVLITPLSASATSETTITRYGTVFTYLGGNSWTVTNTDAAQALKDIDDAQEVLCSNYDTGLKKPCVKDGVYPMTGQFYTERNGDVYSCAYVQGDGGNVHGSWDTVPVPLGNSDDYKRACAPVENPPVTPPVTPPDDDENDEETPELPELPVVSISTVSCESPVNRVTITGLTDDMHLHIATHRIEAKNIPSSQFSYEGVLAHLQLPPIYGTLPVEVTFDNKGSETSLGTISVTFVDPSSLSCTPPAEEPEPTEEEPVDTPEEPTVEEPSPSDPPKESPAPTNPKDPASEEGSEKPSGDNKKGDGTPQKPQPKKVDKKTTPPEELAQTGTEAGTLLIGALLLVAFGVIATVAAVRRKRHS